MEFLGRSDGTLEYGLALRRDVAAAVRRHQPEIVITGNFRETFGPGMLNQADHIAVGRAVLDGVRDAANRWVFRDLLESGFEPWAGVRAVLAAGSPLATHGVDVTDHFATGVESLRAHDAYLRGLGTDMDPAEFLESLSRMTGTRMNCRYAVSFEAFPFGQF